MGLFGSSDADRYREVWFNLNARINGMKLHMPYKWQSLSDSYLTYQQDGVGHIVAFISQSACYKYAQELSSNGIKAHITLIDHCEPKYLIQNAIAIEVERAKKNIVWDIYPEMTGDPWGRTHQW